jgi:hypothetical protein
LTGRRPRAGASMAALVDFLAERLKTVLAP